MVYLHREPIDFRKQIDGSAAIVELTMKQSLSSGLYSCVSVSSVISLNYCIGIKPHKNIEFSSDF